jgi:hypothetical protein
LSAQPEDGSNGANVADAVLLIYFHFLFINKVMLVLAFALTA